MLTGGKLNEDTAAKLSTLSAAALDVQCSSLHSALIISFLTVFLRVEQHFVIYLTKTHKERYHK